MQKMNHWLYPPLIAHRGAGKIAPENTLAAIEIGSCYGYSMFECDVRLSSDGIPFLLHDHTLDRTTNAHSLGLPNSAWQAWSALSAVDAGSWHDPIFAGQPLLRLEQLASHCIANHLMVNLELKPYPGDEHRCGSTVAQLAQKLWEEQTAMPLLSSFQASALAAAQQTAPLLPRALLVDASMHNAIYTKLEQAKELACVAVVYHHSLWTPQTISQAKDAGFKCLTYTVNNAAQAAQLLDWGLDGIITDAIDTIAPNL